MVGQFVTSKAGHDKGTLYVVVGEQGNLLALSDGKGKTTEAPKKKSRKHLQPINAFVADELKEKLASGAKVRPEEIKFAIRQYKETICCNKER